MSPGPQLSLSHTPCVSRCAKTLRPGSVLGSLEPDSGSIRSTLHTWVLQHISCGVVTACGGSDAPPKCEAPEDRAGPIYLETLEYSQLFNEGKDGWVRFLSIFQFLSINNKVRGEFLALRNSGVAPLGSCRTVTDNHYRFLSLSLRRRSLLRFTFSSPHEK